MSDKQTHHILPLKTYLMVGGLLLVLTIITITVAQYDFGELNLLVAMLIAAVKATAVALFFMHLKYDSKLYASVFVGSLAFLAIFIIFVMFDTERRGDVYVERQGQINNKAIIYENGSANAGDPHAAAEETDSSEVGRENNADAEPAGH